MEESYSTSESHGRFSPLRVVKSSLISAFISLFFCAASAIYYLSHRTYGNIVSQVGLLSYIFGDAVGVGSDGAEYILAVLVRSLVIFGLSWGPVTLVLLMAGGAFRKAGSPEHVGGVSQEVGQGEGGERALEWRLRKVEQQLATYRAMSRIGLLAVLIYLGVTTYLQVGVARYGDEINLESVNYPSYFVRHQNWILRISNQRDQYWPKDRAFVITRNGAKP